MRQNQLEEFPEPRTLPRGLEELDLYDNNITEIPEYTTFGELHTLDLSFNCIKHIRNLERCKKLKNLYFVQNKISQITGLEELEGLVNLELGANRIRVGVVRHDMARINVLFGRRLRIWKNWCI